MAVWYCLLSISGDAVLWGWDLPIRHLLCSFVVQAVFRSAQVKQQSITEALQLDAAEAQKLLERQAAAEAQYDQGWQKLQATARQLHSLSSKVCRISGRIIHDVLFDKKAMGSRGPWCGNGIASLRCCCRYSHGLIR